MYKRQVLASRIVQAEQERQAAEQADTRRNLLGSGDRSDKIRTYNLSLIHILKISDIHMVS